MEVNQDFIRPDTSILERFEDVSAALVADVMEHDKCTGTDISPVVDRPPAVVGTALTVKTPAGSNYAVHRALEIAEAGDALVVATDGSVDRAIWGELMSRYSHSTGLNCAIIDGAVRDRAAHSDIDFPVYCRGVTPAGPKKRQEGSVGSTIRCDGVTVDSGDIVVADSDGVTFVPQNRTREVLDRAQAKAETEQTWRRQIKTTDQTLLEIIDE